MGTTAGIGRQGTTLRARLAGLVMAGLFLLFAVGTGCVAAKRPAAPDAAAPGLGQDENPVHRQAYAAARAAGFPADCPAGPADSFTPATPERAGTFLVFSDVHFDPFADPARVKALAAAPVGQWRAILAGASPGLSSYGQDSNDALFQSFLDDMAARVPRPDFLLFPGDLLCHRFWTLYPKLAGDASPAGLASFIEKTAAYFLTEVTRRFPGVPALRGPWQQRQRGGRLPHRPGEPLPGGHGAGHRPAGPDERGGPYGLPGHLSAIRLLRRHPARGRRVAPSWCSNDIFFSKRYPDPALGAPVLAFLERELAGARQAGQKVWVMTHIPPGDDNFASARTFGKKGQGRLRAPAGRRAERRPRGAPDGLRPGHQGLVRRARPPRRFPALSRSDRLAGRNHAPDAVDFAGNGQQSRAYQVYAYDRQSAEILDVTTYFLDLGRPGAAWSLEYVYSATYGSGLARRRGLAGRIPGFWRLRRPAGRPTRPTSTCETCKATNRPRRTFPVFWRAMAAPTRQAFAAWTMPVAPAR